MGVLRRASRQPEPIPTPVPSHAQPANVECDACRTPANIVATEVRTAEGQTLVLCVDPTPCLDRVGVVRASGRR